MNREKQNLTEHLFNYTVIHRPSIAWMVPVLHTGLNQSHFGRRYGQMSLLKEFGLPEGSEHEKLLVIMRDNTLMRLRGTCFRGMNTMKAGNFSKWRTAFHFMNDQKMMDSLFEELLELYNDRDFDSHSLCVEYENPVGWESTAPIWNYQKEELEEFHPNNRSVALRVKAECGDLRAPKTKFVTIIFEFKLEEKWDKRKRVVSKHPVAIIHSLYPGKDIGNLQGNITEEEEIVFFDFHHPGE